MRTIKALKAENEKLRKEVDGMVGNFYKKERSKIIDQISLNNRCIQIIHLKVTPAVIIKQLDDCNTTLKLIESKFDEWKKNTPHQAWGKNPETTYKNLNNVASLKSKINFLNYLLT